MGERRHDTWHRRAKLAAAVRVSYFGLPVVVSFVASGLVTRISAVQELPILWRWLLVVAVSTVVLVTVHRSLARLLPLAALLEVSVAFPGVAPSRYAVARDAGNIAKLREIVAKAQRGDAVVRADDAQAAREILALVAALRSHDRRTRGHSERVRVFTDLIAEEMGLRPDDRERLRWAALLHDVGKLKVPASVLNKPGKLNGSEWDMIRLHPDAGARLVAPLGGWLGDWSRTIPDHHERYDGTGYPRGLAGADISLGGRILAVADSFEVMTSPRSYKKPLSREDALRELRRYATTQFDPQVVRALLAISAPKLRWAMGPLAWVASTPFALATPTASTIVIQAGAATLSVSAVALVTPLPASAPSHQPSKVAAQRSSGHTVVKPRTRTAPKPNAVPTTHPTPAQVQPTVTKAVQGVQSTSQLGPTPTPTSVGSVKAKKVKTGKKAGGVPAPGQGKAKKAKKAKRAKAALVSQHGQSGSAAQGKYRHGGHDN